MAIVLLVFLVLVVVNFAIIAPLCALFRYAAAIDARYARWSGLLSTLYFEESERNSSEATLRGCLLLLSIPALIAGIYLLILGPLPVAGVLLSLMCAGVWYGTIYEKRYLKVAPMPRPQGEKTIAANCPNCGATGYLKPGKVQQVRCGHCQHVFYSVSTDRRLQSWLAGLTIAVLWIMMVRPLRGGFVPPEQVLISSLVALGLSGLWQFIAELRRREKCGRTIDFKVLGDLRNILTVIAASAFAFWILNQSLATLLNLERRRVTIRLVQRSLSWADWLLAILKRWDVPLCLSAAAIIIGLILVRNHSFEAAKRVFKTRKQASTFLKNVTLVLLSLASFSLAGATSAGCLVQTSKYGLSPVGSDVNRNLEGVSRALAREVIALPTAESLSTNPSWQRNCSILNERPSCAARLPQALQLEINRGDALRARWQGTGSAIPVPFLPDPRATVSVGTSDVRTLVQKLDGAARNDTRDTDPDAADFESVTVEDLDRAADEIGAPAAEDGTGSGQRKEIAGLLIEVAFDELGFDPANALKRHVGEVHGRLAGTVFSDAQNHFQDAIRDGVLKLSKACGGGPAACHRAAMDIVLKVSSDARAHPYVLLLSSRAASVARSATDAILKLRRNNDVAERAFVRFQAPAVAREKADRWTFLRSAWARHPDLTPGWEGRIRDLDTEWAMVVERLALAAGAAGRTGPQDGWDNAFLDFLRSHPQHAKTVAEMTLRVDPIGGTRPETFADAYLRFARKLSGTTQIAADPRDLSVVHDPVFSPRPVNVNHNVRSDWVRGIDGNDAVRPHIVVDHPHVFL